MDLTLVNGSVHVHADISMKTSIDTLRFVLLLTGIVLIIAGACAPLYIPPVTHVPALEKQGEGDAAVFVGSGGFDGQFAYSPWKNMMLRGAVSYYDPGDPSATNLMRLHGHTYGEIAGGPYTAARKGLRAHLLAGVGTGSATMLSPDYSTSPMPGTDSVSARYWRLFVQGYIGSHSVASISKSPRIYNMAGLNAATEYGLAARYALVPFRGILHNGEHIANRTAGFLELQAVVRAGSDDIGFEVQTGPIFRLDGGEEELGIWNWFTLSLGMRARF